MHRYETYGSDIYNVFSSLFKRPFNLEPAVSSAFATYLSGSVFGVDFLVCFFDFTIFFNSFVGGIVGWGCVSFIARLNKAW